MGKKFFIWTYSPRGADSEKQLLKSDCALFDCSSNFLENADSAFSHGRSFSDNTKSFKISTASV